jgi:DNA-directed RNA polymerase subunit RPC12/RpoP
VVFLYRDRKDDRRRKVQLHGNEFLRRFLQHVWPRGIHRVQYHGLWSRKSRPKLQALKSQLAEQPKPPELSAATPPTTKEITTSAWLRCPHCGGLRIVHSRFPRNGLLPALTRPAHQTSTAEEARPP